LGDAELAARMLADRVVPAVRDREHSVTRYLRLVTDLGIPALRPLIFPMPAGDPIPDFDPAEPFLLIHPFARGNGKSLSPESLAGLCNLFAPIRIVIVGRTDTQIEARCENLCNRTSLAQLIWLIRNAAFTVSVDSGPMHIAAALTPNLLGIHTWSDPRLVGPCNPEAWIWKNGALMQFKELTREPMAGGRNVGAEDLPALAAFCKSRLS
jgi:ADP-heptose:LPS heptosyltransferase